MPVKQSIIFRVIAVRPENSHFQAIGVATGVADVSFFLLFRSVDLLHVILHDEVCPARETAAFFRAMQELEVQVKNSLSSLPTPHPKLSTLAGIVPN